MRIDLYRKTSNRLYTSGELFVNRKRFTHAIEHTLTMLPIGEYQVKLKKVGKSHRILSLTPTNLAYRHPTLLKAHPSITKGNSWRDALNQHSIIIGEPLIPGCVQESPKYYELLFERIEKCRTPITLAIHDFDCREDQPISHWLEAPDHGCVQ